MRIVVRTQVNQSVAQVAEGFTESLFTQLNPPFPPVRLLRFDGSRTGDVVSLQLNFLLFRQIWTSHITEAEQTPTLFRFVDEGVTLPFFLNYWHHHHQVVATANGSTIIDDITYRGPFRLLTWLLYPVLKLQFLYRKPIYRRVFC